MLIPGQKKKGGCSQRLFWYFHWCAEKPSLYRLSASDLCPSFRLNRGRWWEWCMFGRCVVTRKSWTPTLPGDSWTSLLPARSRSSRWRNAGEKVDMEHKLWWRAEGARMCLEHLQTLTPTYIYLTSEGRVHPCSCVMPEAVFACTPISNCYTKHLCAYVFIQSKMQEYPWAWRRTASIMISSQETMCVLLCTGQLTVWISRWSVISYISIHFEWMERTFSPTI